MKAVRAGVAAGCDLVKIMVTGGAIDPPTNRRRSQYGEEELRAAIDDAHRLGKRVVGHANATEGITRAVHAGIDIVAHCNWLGGDPGTVWVEESTVARMAEQGVWVDLNVEGALRDLKSTDGTVVAWEHPGPHPSARWELLQPLRLRGIGVYLTSDAFGPGIGQFPSALCTAQRRWDCPSRRSSTWPQVLPPRRSVSIGNAA